MTLDPESETIIVRTIQREGGLVDHPADPGGITKYGITRIFYAEYLKQPVAAVTRAMIADLTVEAATTVYRWHLTRLRLDAIVFIPLRELLFDFTVNSFYLVGIRALHRALGIAPGTVIGSETIRRLASVDSSQAWLTLYIRVWVARERYYGEQAAAAHPFIHGWIERNTGLLLETFTRS